MLDFDINFNLPDDEIEKYAEEKLIKMLIEQGAKKEEAKKAVELTNLVGDILDGNNGGAVILSIYLLLAMGYAGGAFTKLQLVGLCADITKNLIMDD